MCCIAMMISIIITIIQGGLCRFWYERTYFFLPSARSDTRKEKQFIRAYANHTMLTPPPKYSASCYVTTHLCWSKPELISFDQIRKTQQLALTVEPQLLSFQNPKIFRIISSGYDVNHPLNSLQRFSSPIFFFCLEVYSNRWRLSYHFRAGVQVGLQRLNQEIQSSSKPYQTK